MNRLFLKSYIIIFSAGSILLSCKEKKEEPTPVLEATIVSNLPADPDLNPDGTPRIKTNHFTLFSFNENSIISNADSASGKWDIGFRNSTLIINGGTSGPGSAEAQIVNGIFEEIIEAPITGYVKDNGGTYAIKGNNGWYTYTAEATSGPQHAILPIPGRIIILKTANGNYVKIEILSYYKDNPNTTTAEFADVTKRSAPKYYTFRYVYQSNQSTNLK